tara:strand:+ start:27366 stop:28307 length:942 start_codon:yes stop_codon:yes gene_type:complete
MSKYAYGGGSIYNKGSGKRLETTIYYYGRVTSNFDELGANRIKVRVVGVDDSIIDSDLNYAFPMLQKFFHVIPKIGETVMVFIPDVKNPYIDRMYLGPIISQPQNLRKDSDLFSAKSTLSSGIKQANPAPFTIPENKGVYPDLDSIAIQGRNNSDIILKEKEVLIRAGQFDSATTGGDIPNFNLINPSYIQVKHDAVLADSDDTSNNQLGGVVNVVSDKINLLTHKNGTPRFRLNDQGSMVTDKEIQRIVDEAHPLVFGDNLIEFLKIFINAFTNHVHPYSGMKPQDLSGSNDIPKLLEYNLESLLSRNIKIN